MGSGRGSPLASLSLSPVCDLAILMGSSDLLPQPPFQAHVTVLGFLIPLNSPAFCCRKFERRRKEKHNPETWLFIPRSFFICPDHLHPCRVCCTAPSGLFGVCPMCLHSPALPSPAQRYTSSTQLHRLPTASWKEEWAREELCFSRLSQQKQSGHGQWALSSGWHTFPGACVPT